MLGLDLRLIRPGRLLVVVAGTVAGASLLGCGSSGERELTAAGFVEEMNASGAALQLGTVLATNPDGADVYTLAFAEPAPSAPGEGSAPSEAEGSATLVITAVADAAREEFARCERTTDLTCFRAANVVLRAERLQSVDRARITTALETLETVEG